MVKRCQWGTCNSDSRYPDRLKDGIYFIPFPKPKRNLEKCRRWIKSCGRPHDQLNIQKVDGNYQLYVCSKHFPEGKPTESFPDPVQASFSERLLKVTPVRRPPKRRPESEPPVSRKKRNILSEIFSSVNNENINEQHIDNSSQSTNEFCADVSVQTDFHQGVSPMDLLTLAAENHGLKSEVDLLQQQISTLQNQVADKILRNEELSRENEILRQENGKLKKKREPVFSKGLFSVRYVQQSKIKNNFKYYTGFVYTQFLCILNFLMPKRGLNELPFKLKKTISKALKMKAEDQLLLVLMKLRLNLQFHHLGNLFNLSPQDTGAIFREWINYMYYRFGSVPLWPSRSSIIDMMPKTFREDFPTTMIILDGTEIKLEKPSSLRSQSQCYSDYKSCTTLKGLVGVDPRGSFTFISMLFTGGTSDNEITARSGLMDMLKQLLDCGRLQRGDAVMVDKGFLIREDIEKLGLELIIPPFASSTEQMPPSDVALTQKIAKHRIHVERAISRVKKFKIVDHRLDLTLYPSINQIWFCCCFLTGFMPLLIKDQGNKLLIT